MKLPEWLIRLLMITALPMDPPKPFGVFHISALVLSILIPVLLIRLFPVKDKAKAERILVILGWVLAISEVYKQLFFYVIINNGRYDIWYFPFQLCSMGMYLAILLPILKGRAKRTAFTFLVSFSLPGAVLALLFPEGMLRSYWTMTLHGFFWHAILVYMALVVCQARLADFSNRGFFDAMVLYLGLAGTAVILNLVLTPLSSYGTPDFFYLSPYIKTSQFFFRVVAEHFGIRIEHIVYVALYILLCYLTHRAARRLVSD